MMNIWGHIGEGESVLEPSAGHGAIARYVPRENPLTAVEPSHNLFGKLQLKAGGNGRKFENDIFENYNVVNKHDVVLMNPPFGVGGRMAVDHVAKAFQHLDEGGRIVAIIPRGSTDKKFEKWYEAQNDAVLTAEIGLPDITFERAGTSVNCRVVVIDKVTNKELRSDAASRAVHVDLSGMHFDKIEDFFEEIRDIRVPERTIDYKAKMKKKAAPVARELRGLKGIQKVELDEDRIFVNGRGLWSSLQWGDRQGSALLNHLSKEYVRFKKSEEYANSRDNGLQTAVYGELKELCCKLAGMTEDEMQRYIDRSEKDEDLYREDDWDNKKTPITDQPNRANEKPVSGSVPASIHRDSSSNAMASKQADAKIDNDTQSAKTKIKKYRNGDFFVDVNTLDKALSDIGKILSMRTKGGSRYSILRTNSGNTVAIRLSDHLANGNNFKRDNASSNLSIVIERHIYNTQGESNIEYTEAVIKEETFNNSPSKVINAIVNGVNDVLEDKEFTLDSSIGTVSVEGPLKIEDENLRTGDGSLSDEELSYENDPVAKWLGESKRSKNQQQEYAQRIRERMVKRVNELAAQLNLDNVEIVTDASTLEGKLKGLLRNMDGIFQKLPRNTWLRLLRILTLKMRLMKDGSRRLRLSLCVCWPKPV